VLTSEIDPAFRNETDLSAIDGLSALIFSKDRPGRLFPVSLLRRLVTADEALHDIGLRITLCLGLLTGALWHGRKFAAKSE
jgi:hypothetical protein